jgi:hypothetical protein
VTYRVKIDDVWREVPHASTVEFDGGALQFYDYSDDLVVAYGPSEWQSVEFSVEP